MKALQIAAMLFLVALVVLTVIPAAERPVTGLGHGREHFVAFALAGVLLALGFPRRLPAIVAFAVLFTLAIELIQIPLPTRHARLMDFIVDAAAMLAGILAARLWRAVPP